MNTEITTRAASRPRPVQVTKEMLGIQTRKSILYLDQNVFSSVFRGSDPQWQTAMRRITELLDLQLIAVPYSSTHEAEADFYTHRDELVKFIQGMSRGHHFKPYYSIEETQIVKAFQAYLKNAPAAYVKEERDALPSSVHDWDGQYSVSVFRNASDVARKRGFKRRAVEELVTILRDWAASTNTFEQDMAVELKANGRLLVESYGKKVSRLFRGDFSAMTDSPISASIVEDLMFVAKELKVDPAQAVPGFFASRHFAEVPSVQLSARLFSTFKKRVREGAYPNPEKAREKLSGFLFDVQHAATHVPYCAGYFTDRFMADLLNDKNVAAEQTFGCKVFSVSGMAEFFDWLADVKTKMTAGHVDGLKWVYPKRYRT